MGISDLAAENADPHLPGKLLLQWHITDRCNYRCRHCYQERFDGAEPDLGTLRTTLTQFQDLLAELQERSGRERVRAHVTVTGGEPFLHPNVAEVLELLSANHNWTSFGVLSNGSLIDARRARWLKNLGVAFVQISIDGTPATHDFIRGETTHLQAVAALKELRRAGVRTLIAFTAQRGNFREFPAVARLGRKHGVGRVWADRFIPQGCGEALARDALTPVETREFFTIMRRARGGKLAALFSRTEIHMGRALQFLCADGRPYACQAGNGLITIMPDGSLYPCRRLPLAVGNVFTTPLTQLYFEHPLLRALRDPARLVSGCEACFYAHLCRGGLRCLSTALHGDPFRADPGCWRATNRPPPGSDDPPSHLAYTR